MAYEPGDPIRLTRPVPRIGGELPARFRMTVEDAWLDRSGRELVNAQAGAVGVSCLPADAIERVEPLPAIAAAVAPIDPFDALRAAGWRISPKPYINQKHSITRQWAGRTVNATWDRATELMSVWGVGRWITLAECLVEYSAEREALAEAAPPAAPPPAAAKKKPAPIAKPRPRKPKPAEIVTSGRTAQRSLLGDD